jgi:hypothetical protein
VTAKLFYCPIQHYNNHNPQRPREGDEDIMEWHHLASEVIDWAISGLIKTVTMKT